MSTLELQRIITAGWNYFSRAKTVTFASVIVTTLSLMVVAVVVFANALLAFTLNEISGRVDVNVYFVPQTSDDIVVNVAQSIAKLDYVKEVTVTSAQEALESFKERHKYDELTLQALEELDENPLGASLAVKTIRPEDYNSLAEFLNAGGGLSENIQAQIEKVNFYQNEKIIERITNLMAFVHKAGLAVSMAFLVVAIIVVMNTVRLAIYSARDEISVMRLVGAPASKVQGPFFVTGMLYGFSSAILCSFILYPLFFGISEKTTQFFGGFSFIQYYHQNFLWLVFVFIALGIVLGILSTALALQKYLRI